MIPTFDGADFRQYERRVRLFVFTTRVAPQRRAGKLFERLEGRTFESCEGIQDLETPHGAENLLDHLRTHFEDCLTPVHVNSTWLEAGTRFVHCGVLMRCGILFFGLGSILVQVPE